MLQMTLLDQDGPLREEQQFVNSHFADTTVQYSVASVVEPDYTTTELEADILALLDRSTTALCSQEIRRGLHQQRSGLSKKLINSTLYRMQRRGSLVQSRDGSDVYWRRSAL